MSYIKKFFQNFTNFSGRTTRKDYWMTVLYFALFGFAMSMLFGILAAISPAIGMIFIIIYLIALLGLLIGSFAIVIRRLHDSGKSGAFILMGLIPFVGAIVLLVFLCSPSDPGMNQYGMPEDMPYMDNHYDSPNTTPENN